MFSLRLPQAALLAPFVSAAGRCGPIGTSHVTKFGWTDRNGLIRSCVCIFGFSYYSVIYVAPGRLVGPSTFFMRDPLTMVSLTNFLIDSGMLDPDDMPPPQGETPPVRLRILNLARFPYVMCRNCEEPTVETGVIDLDKQEDHRLHWKPPRLNKRPRPAAAPVDGAAPLRPCGAAVS